MQGNVARETRGWRPASRPGDAMAADCARVIGERAGVHGAL